MWKWVGFKIGSGIMKTIDIVIQHKGGLHARPAGQLVGVSGKFESKIELEYNGKNAAGNSILKILSLAVPEGATFTAKANGPDAENALAAIKSFIESLD